MATERAMPRILTAADISSIFRPATPEELARRRKVWDDLLRLHREIGPIRGITTAELLDEEGDEVNE